MKMGVGSRQLRCVLLCAWTNAVAALPECQGPLTGGGKQYSCEQHFTDKGTCEGYTQVPRYFAQCGSSGGNCLTTGPVCEVKQAPVGYAQVNLWANGESTMVDENGKVTSLGTKPEGSVQRGDKPFMVVGKRGGSQVEWISLSLAGKEFSESICRGNPIQYKVYGIENAEVTLYQNGDKKETKAVTKGNVTTFQRNGANQHVSFKSTGLIVMAYSAANAQIDFGPGVPSAVTIYGFVSSQATVEPQEANQKFEVIQSASNGQTKRHQGTNVKQRFRDWGGAQNSGEISKFELSTKQAISGNTCADHDGGDTTSYVREEDFQKLILIPVTMDYVSFFSNKPAKCTANNGYKEFELTGSSTTQLYKAQIGNNNAPNNGHNTIKAGTVFQCTEPVGAVGDLLPSNDEINFVIVPSQF